MIFLKVHIFHDLFEKPSYAWFSEILHQIYLSIPFSMVISEVPFWDNGLIYDLQLYYDITDMCAAENPL